MLLALGIAISLSQWFLDLQLHYTLLASVISLLTFANALTWLRLQKPWPVSELEIFAQLLLDVTSLSVLMYFSGGAGNPFIFYYLVPVCLSAATLPWAYTWSIAGLSLAAYTLQLFYYVPLPIVAPSSHHHSSGLNLHVIGMWCNFAISALLITYFVAKMAKDLRQRESQLNSAKEQALRNEQVMAVATLAAGTAHELGTPLSTMMVLLEEMQSDNKNNPKITQDLVLLQQQTLACRETLKHLIEKADTTSKQVKPVILATFLERLIEHWMVIRPEVSASQTLDSSLHCSAAFDPAIEQTILNLLNNAADANPSEIEIHAEAKDGVLHLDIGDRGVGIPENIQKNIGSPFLSSKESGFGLGLFLSKATLDRNQGSLSFQKRNGGGTLTKMRLPISETPTGNGYD
jgi:two-component system sensor histidine kinase RegB